MASNNSSLQYENGGDKGWIYLARTPATMNYIPDGCTVFKVGRTVNLPSRFSYYPEGTEVLFTVLCETNLRVIERKIIEKFKNSCMFDWEKRFGNEYFSGEISVAISDIMKIWDTNGGDYDYHNELTKGRWYGKNASDVNSWLEHPDGMKTRRHAYLFLTRKLNK